MKEGRDVPRSATQIRNWSQPPCFDQLGESDEHGSIKWLVLERRPEQIGIVGGNGVVGIPNGVVKVRINYLGDDIWRVCGCPEVLGRWGLLPGVRGSSIQGDRLSRK